MTDFDNFFLGIIISDIIGFIITISLESGKKKKVVIFCVIILFICLLLSIMLAYHYNWPSDILHISDTNDIVSTNEPISTAPSTIESTSQQSLSMPSSENSLSQNPVYNYIFEDIFSEIYETHSPENSVSASVEFRKWDPTADVDLRNDSHSEVNTVSYYASYSNIFNFLGGGGSDGERIVSDIHFPVETPLSLNLENCYLTGSIVATQKTQGSDAYADVAILVDGVEKWRSNERITCNTVQPIEFIINIADVQSEIIIRTSCVPMDKGLSLGFIDINIAQNTDNNDDKSPSTDLSSQEDSPSREEKYVFVNPFENHSPDNNSIHSVIFGNWDTFTHADLRNEHYEGSEYGQLYLKISDTFNILGASDASPIVSEIHLPINPKKDVTGLIWTGLIVAEQNTQGSPAYADIVILVDGVEKWRTTDSITGSTVPPVEYSVDLSDAKYEVIIRTSCAALGDGLALGFVDMKVEYIED